MVSLPAVLPAEGRDLLRIRSVDRSDFHSSNCPSRPCVRLADIAAADQADVNGHMVPRSPNGAHAARPMPVQRILDRIYSCNSAPGPTATTKYCAGVVPIFL